MTSNNNDNRRVEAYIVTRYRRSLKKSHPYLSDAELDRSVESHRNMIRVAQRACELVGLVPVEYSAAVEHGLVSTPYCPDCDAHNYEMSWVGSTWACGHCGCERKPEDL